MVEFNKKVLKNGLTVLHEKRDVPVTTVMIAAKYGSGHDVSEEKGMAHFIEHLCFKGTAKRTVRQIAEEVERVGGELNAFTGDEMTAYHVKLPSNHLEIAMDVMMDIFFNAEIPEAEVKREAGVICEEIKMYHDNPRAHTMEKIKLNLYEEPFGTFGAGTQEIVLGMDRERLLKRHREVYVPRNSVLSVVGNNSFEEVLSLAEKFVVEREGISVESPNVQARNIKDSESRANLQQTNLSLGFHVPFDKKNRYAAELFCSILGEGMSSRLFSEVREKRGLVYGVKSDLDLGKDYGYMIIWAGTDPGKTEEVREICLSEFSKMKDLTEKELEEAKIRAIGKRQVESEDSNDVAVDLIFEEILGDAHDYYSFEKGINEVSLEDVRSLSDFADYAFFSVGP